MMLKIGIDIRELAGDRITGINRFLLNFIKYAVEKRENWQFFLYGNQTTKIEIESPNLYKIFVPERFTLLWDQISLPNQLKKDNIDLFFSPYPKAPLRLHAKLIITICDLIPLKVPVYRNLKNRFYFEFFVRKLAHRADRIITISENSKSDIVEILDVPPEKIKVIYPVIDKSFRKVNPGDILRERYGINKKFIFYLGRSKPHKNVRGLLEAYNLLPLDLKNEYDLIIGGVRGAGLTDGVKYLGFIPDSDLVNFYSAAEVFVFPSFYEGFGLPVLEAMACGCPVVCSRTSSLPEVVGDSGILVNPHNSKDISDAIEMVLRDESLRKKLSIKGINKSKCFNLEEMAQDLLGCMEY